jgi:xylulokinase
MYLGIDLGTSSVKVVLVDHAQQIVAQATAPLTVQRPRDGWSEQNPEAWWQATDTAMTTLGEQAAGQLQEVAAIGLSGQMHGATLIDDRDRVLRPAILWNDGRSDAQCKELTRRVPDLAKITGNLAMPGFTAPKLLWVAQHESELFSRIARVLLPKDYLRLRMCGNYASDMSDSAGTLWLAVGKRAWSSAMLDACGLSTSQMPTLHEGPEATGVLLPGVATRWGLSNKVVVAAGAGDNAAGAIGVGVVKPGQALVSLGTSGVYFVSSERFAPNPADAVHAFCHALPNTWHQMSVILSAASCIDWSARLTGLADASTLLAEIDSSPTPRRTPIFLPYLSGERTPHNDTHARGVFFDLDHDTDRVSLGRAVLEGICFAMADAERALSSGHIPIDSVLAIGGGARSPLLLQLLASTLGRSITTSDEADAGPAFGAARLARLCVTGETIEAVCTAPQHARTIEPVSALAAPLARRYARYRALYPALKASFANHAGDLA